MAASHLIAVAHTAPAAAPSVETGAQRVRHLQEEARALAREQIDLLIADVSDIAGRAAEIAESGDAYPVGVRELASRMADDLAIKAKSITSIMERVAHA